MIKKKKLNEKDNQLVFNNTRISIKLNLNLCFVKFLINS